MALPVKPACTIEEHVRRLSARGMAVDDALARQWFSYVSYYRLSAYWYTARQEDENGVKTDWFTAGTRFSDCVKLYEADRKLRTLVHDGMEHIEIALRCRMGETLCFRDPLFYRHSANFRDDFDHGDWLDNARKRVRRARRNNAAIRHYQNNYNSRFPFWVLAEVLDFSDISRLFEGMVVEDQREIASALGLNIVFSELGKRQKDRFGKAHPLTRWLEQLTIVRNISAHHGRLWNRKLMPVSTVAFRTMPNFHCLPPEQSERIFGSLTMMAFLLSRVSPGTTWPTKVGTLIDGEFLENPLVSPGAMGLPVQWDSAAWVRQATS